MGTDTPPESLDADTAESESSSTDSEAVSGPTQNPEHKKDRGWALAITLMAAAVVGVLLVTQVLLLSSLNDAKSEIASLQSQIDGVDDSVSTLSDEIAAVAESVDEATTASATSGSSSSAVTPQQTSIPAGYLPRFDRNQPDQALGMTLGAIEGIDGYSEELVSVEPADGTRRIWMVWAHWCPFCQQEMPLLSDWYPTIENEYETELVTVSTNIDPSRGNPLAAYLEDEQFPFPVVVDPDSQLAVQMGVSAFPFWVITDGDGEVLLRTTGLLQVEQVANLFDQVETFAG
jgi:thiol-disulfide isomerase/thioredoxin